MAPIGEEDSKLQVDRSSVGAADVRNADGQLCLLVTLSSEDPLYQNKKKLLNARGFGPEVQVIFSSSESPSHPLKKLVEATRIVHLYEDELYFTELDTSHPVSYYSPRNEMQSLNSVLSLIDSSLKGATNKTRDILIILRDATLDMIRDFSERHVEELIIEKCTCHAEDFLLQWGGDHGVKTKLQIVHVKGAGRGAVPIDDLEIGDTALEIPESIIISEDVLYDSDMYHVLKELDNITMETMMLLWSMKERYNCVSKYRIFFETFPKTFNTGLSFGVEALTALEGTLLFEEIIQAKEHLRMQYAALCPALCDGHPDLFQQEMYTWDSFLWACELWYSNSMKVVFTDGKLKTCLVPIAGLLNHSVCPHILNYGRVDSATNSLKFSLSRPCRKGEQCYLSYGNLSSSHLVTFYGFLPKGENLYDVIPLDFDAPQGDDPSPESNWSTHMVRGTWLSSNHKLFFYGLPPPLLNYLRATLNDSKQPTETYIDSENEKVVLETLVSIFNPMLEGLGDSESIQREKHEWDVKLALEFKDLQRRTISSVLDSCSAGLKMLQCLELEESMPFEFCFPDPARP